MCTRVYHGPTQVPSLFMSLQRHVYQHMSVPLPGLHDLAACSVAGTERPSISLLLDVVYLSLKGESKYLHAFPA